MIFGGLGLVTYEIEPHSRCSTGQHVGLITINRVDVYNSEMILHSGIGQAGAYCSRESWSRVDSTCNSCGINTIETFGLKAVTFWCTSAHLGSSSNPQI